MSPYEEWRIQGIDFLKRQFDGIGMHDAARRESRGVPLGRRTEGKSWAAGKTLFVFACGLTRVAGCEALYDFFHRPMRADVYNFRHATGVNF